MPRPCYPCLALPLLLSVLGGCATSTPPPAEAPATPAPPPKEAVATRPIDRDTLFELLVAEFAGKRDRADLALSTYVDVAKRTRDPLVLERASGIARYLGDHEAALETALVWVKAEPDNPAAREAAATQLIRAQRLDEAMDHVEALLAQDVELNFDFLLNAGSQSNREVMAALVTRFDTLLTRYPDNAQLWFSRGLLRHELDPAQGLDDVEAALQRDPDYVNALIAKGRLLEERGDVDAAIAFFDQATAVRPEEKRLGLAHARMLLRQKRLDLAMAAFDRLSAAFPDDSDLTLSLALVAWENNAEDVAVTQLEKLLDTERASEARAYLGRIAVTRDQPDQAITHLSHVEPGPHYNAARLQMAGLLAREGRIDDMRASLVQARAMSPRDALQFFLAENELLSEAGRHREALATLEQARQAFPGNADLDYSHAMLLGQTGRIADMERALRALLARDADNIDALNALGYTLADEGRQLDEAEKLIEKAYARAPENPAIIDSLGWLRYRQGRLDEALQLLRKAYERFPDHEVAAHLGEVLWVSGDQEAARTVWREGLGKRPDSPIIRGALERLKVTLD